MHVLCPAIISRFKTDQKHGLGAARRKSSHQPIHITMATMPAAERSSFTLMPIIFLATMGVASAFVIAGYQNYAKITEAAKEVAILHVLSGHSIGTGAAQGRIYDAWEQSVYATMATASRLHTDSKNNFIAVDVHLRGQVTPDVRTYERHEKDGNPNCWVPTGATTAPKAYLCTNRFDS